MGKITKLRGLDSASMLWMLLCRRPVRLFWVAGYTRRTEADCTCMILGITSGLSLTKTPKRSRIFFCPSAKSGNTEVTPKLHKRRNDENATSKHCMT